MAGHYLSVSIHVIWSTKGRRRLLVPQWSHRLHPYIASVARFKNACLKAANTQPDHLHLLVSMPSTVTIAEMVNAFKANSSRWIRQNFPYHKWFGWQAGYAAFSVSRSDEDAVIEYIRNQDEHHKRQSFEEEVLDLLERHRIECDPKYVLD